MEAEWGGGRKERGCQARIRDEIRSRRCLSQETISIHTLPPPALLSDRSLYLVHQLPSKPLGGEIHQRDDVRARAHTHMHAAHAHLAKSLHVIP